MLNKIQTIQNSKRKVFPRVVATYIQQHCECGLARDPAHARHAPLSPGAQLCAGVPSPLHVVMILI